MENNCSQCLKRCFDPNVGIYCKQLGTKQSESTPCPGYEEDSDLIKRKQEIALNDVKKDVSISGWLAFYLYVYMGLDLILLLCQLIVTFSTAKTSADLTGVILMLPFFASYILTAILTIIYFFLRRGETIRIAYSNIIAKTSSLLIIFCCLNNVTGLLVYKLMMSIFWIVTWSIYLKKSRQVARVIPVEIRCKSKVAKVCNIISIVYCGLIVVLFTFFALIKSM